MEIISTEKYYEVNTRQGKRPNKLEKFYSKAEAIKAAQEFVAKTIGYDWYAGIREVVVTKTEINW